MNALREPKIIPSWYPRWYMPLCARITSLRDPRKRVIYRHTDRYGNLIVSVLYQGGRRKAKLSGPGSKGLHRGSSNVKRLPLCCISQHSDCL
jgi:hypothetical protein